MCSTMAAGEIIKDLQAQDKKESLGDNKLDITERGLVGKLLKPENKTKVNEVLNSAENKQKTVNAL